MRAFLRSALAALALLPACGTPLDTTCDRVVARQSRCAPTTPACQLTDLRRQCASDGQQLRADYVMLTANCADDTVACNAGGDRAIADCRRAHAATLTVSAAGRAAIASVCAKCPSAAGAMDAATCVAHSDAPSTTGDGFHAVVNLAVTLTDAANSSLGACAMAAPDGADACSAVSRCVSALSTATAPSCTPPPTASCSGLVGSAVATCTETVNALPGVIASVGMTCGLNGGRFAMGTCQALGRIGGCRLTGGVTTETTWYYAASNQLEEHIRQLCTGMGAEFVAP